MQELRGAGNGQQELRCRKTGSAGIEGCRKWAGQELRCRKRAEQDLRCRNRGAGNGQSGI